MILFEIIFYSPRLFLRPFVLIENLSLENNEFTGMLLGGWSVFDQLEVMRFAGNDFSGTIPSEWRTMTNLKTLTLGRNEKLSGEIPSFFGTDLQGLVEIGLERTAVEGTIPTSLGKLTDLKRLYLHTTDVEGAMPEDICRMLPPEGSLQEVTADCAARVGTVECNCCTQCFWRD